MINNNSTYDFDLFFLSFLLSFIVSQLQSTRDRFFSFFSFLEGFFLFFFHNKQTSKRRKKALVSRHLDEEDQNGADQVRHRENNDAGKVNFASEGSVCTALEATLVVLKLGFSVEVVGRSV